MSLSRMVRYVGNEKSPDAFSLHGWGTFYRNGPPVLVRDKMIWELLVGHPNFVVTEVSNVDMEQADTPNESPAAPRRPRGRPRRDS